MITKLFYYVISAPAELQVLFYGERGIFLNRMYYFKNILKNPHILPSLLAIGERANSSSFRFTTTEYINLEKIKQIFEKVLTSIFT